MVLGEVCVCMNLGRRFLIHVYILHGKTHAYALPAMRP